MAPKRHEAGAGLGSDSATLGRTPRRRTDAERQTIVAEAFADGNSVSDVAEQRGVSTASIYLWRRQLREAKVGDARKTPVRRSPPSPHASSARPPSPVTFAPVRIATAPEAAALRHPTRAELIEIALANGRILRVCEGIDPVKLARLVAALESTAP
jgi:transposase-like protein